MTRNDLPTIRPPCAQDVTTSVSINQGTIRLNKKTGFFEQSITVTNTSNATIQGPVSFMLSGLSGATLVNATGTTSCTTPVGSPFINLNLGAATNLKPGKSGKATLQFNSASAGYTPKVLAGPNSP